MEKNPTIEALIEEKQQAESIIETILNDLVGRYPYLKINVEIERQTAISSPVSAGNTYTNFRARVSIGI